MSGPAICQVIACGKQATRTNRTVCEAHYYRKRRTGTYNEALPIQPWRPLPGVCSIEGCDTPADSRGWCATHYSQWRRTGDPLTFIPYEQRSWRTGPGNNKWKGDQAGYGACHARVRRTRGSAREHLCIDCQEPAAQWSLRHDEPGIVIDKTNGLPCHPDPMAYSPRCVPCHKRYDLARSA